MDSLAIIIWICIAIPITLSLIFLEQKSRRVIGFVIGGTVICLVSSWANGIIYNLVGADMFFFTSNVSPIVEEIIKALPLLVYAILISDDKNTLISIAMSLGIGFAIMENILIFVQNGADLDILWAVQRVFSASLMHSITTMAVGFGLSFVKKKKKLFYTGTFALLVLAMVYHSVYNTIVQSDYPVFGLLMPIVTYIPFAILKIMDRKKTKTAKA